MKTNKESDILFISYFFAETLKYLYLTFVDPSVMSLDEWVYSTEAHAFKLENPIEVQAKF